MADTAALHNAADQVPGESVMRVAVQPPRDSASLPSVRSIRAPGLTSRLDYPNLQFV